MGISLKLARADIIGKGNAKQKIDFDSIDELEIRIARLKQTDVKSKSTNTLAVTGNDIMRVLGIAPGPEVGRILAILHDIVFANEEMNCEFELLKVVESFASTINR